MTVQGEESGMSTTHRNASEYHLDFCIDIMDLFANIVDFYSRGQFFEFPLPMGLQYIK